MTEKLKPEDVVLGHVSMSKEAHARIPREQRAGVWARMIAELGISGPYLPIPYEDEATDVVGMNLVGIPTVVDSPTEDDARHAE